MVGELDPVQERVAEHHVGMRHVDLGPEHFFSLRVFPRFHFPEQFQVLFRGAVPPGAGRAGLVHGAAVQADLFLSLVIHIGQAAFDQVFGPLVELVEVVRRVQLLVPLESQPPDVFLDGIYILGIFLGGVGVVVAEVGFSAVLLRQPEIQADTLGMAQVKVSVGLRREAGHDRIHFALCEVPFDDFFQKIQLFFFHSQV